MVNTIIVLYKDILYILIPINILYVHVYMLLFLYYLCFLYYIAYKGLITKHR